MDDSKKTVFYKYNRTNMYMNSENVTAFSRPAQVQTKQNSSTKRKWEQNPTPAQMIFVIDTCWEREK